MILPGKEVVVITDWNRFKFVACGIYAACKIIAADIQGVKRW
ncbi:hypothetical protein CHISP_1472 [Chitinispirillum alkaliphilum]|nr:hypothetical protein CHISP_1472 [Chitinispirillum alkaliphilum]